DGWIINKLHLALDFRSELASHLNLFLQREEIQTALVDVTVSDVLHIGILLFVFLLGFGFVLILILILVRGVGLVALVVLGKQRQRNRNHERQEKHKPYSGNLMTHVVSPRQTRFILNTTPNCVKAFDGRIRGWEPCFSASHNILQLHVGTQTTVAAVCGLRQSSNLGQTSRGGPRSASAIARSLKLIDRRYSH